MNHLYAILLQKFGNPLKFSLAVRWMSHSDAKFDVEVNQIEDYLKSKEIGKPVYEKATRKVEDTGAGNITLLFDPFENLYERSGNQEFLERFPEIVTEVCITNKVHSSRSVLGLVRVRPSDRPPHYFKHDHFLEK